MVVGIVFPQTLSLLQARVDTCIINAKAIEFSDYLHTPYSSFLYTLSEGHLAAETAYSVPLVMTH